jgi:hypothetical protein
VHAGDAERRRESGRKQAPKRGRSPAKELLKRRARKQSRTHSLRRPDLGWRSEPSWHWRLLTSETRMESCPTSMIPLRWRVPSCRLGSRTRVCFTKFRSDSTTFRERRAAHPARSVNQRRATG